MIVLDGKKIAAQRRHILADKLKQLKASGGICPGVAVILASPDPSSHLYVQNKQKACQSVGMESFVHSYKEPTQAQLQEKITQLNQDPRVHGILVQLPLPASVNTRQVLDSIAPHKDVDALSTHSLGRLLTGQSVVKPCTPMGIMALLDHYNIDVKGQRVCVVGRSLLVGQPTALLLQAQGATVTLCHSHTKNLSDHTRASDIVVVAAGRKHLLSRDDFKQQAVVVDVGIHRADANEAEHYDCKSELDARKTEHSARKAEQVAAVGSLVKSSLRGTAVTGDVNPVGLDSWLRAFSPVPGGVGPMTVAMLLENAYTLATL